MIISIIKIKKILTDLKLEIYDIYITKTCLNNHVMFVIAEKFSKLD